MDITGHFESASCVIEVDGSDTLAQVKGKLVVELGVPRARHVGVRMRGGGDIGSNDVRICDTAIDEGCAVELYYAGANITPGVIPHTVDTRFFRLSPCDRYLAVMHRGAGVSIFDTETHERLYRFPGWLSIPAFSPCSEWISSFNKGAQCCEVHDVKTGALEHSFGVSGVVKFLTTTWSPCGTKLLSCCSKGLQVRDIATGVVVHEWSHIANCYEMVVAGDRVVTFDGSNNVTIWDYTTGVEVLVLTCPSDVEYVTLSPNQRFLAACCNECMRVWNIETGECVFEAVSEHWANKWWKVAVSNDIVAAQSDEAVCVWSISTSEKLLHLDVVTCNFNIAISSCGGVVMYGRDEGVEILDISHLS